MTTVFQVCSDAADELSLARPAQIVGSSDPTAQKLLRHLYKTIRGTAKRDDWRNLMREHTFNTANATESYVLPDNFLRFVGDTIWNRTRRFKLSEATTPQEWQAYKAAVTGMVFQACRVRGVGTATPQIFIAPIPSGVETIAFEWITSVVGLNGLSEVTTFADDDNTFLLDSELLTLGVVWRYKKAEGQDYSEEFREFEMCRLDLLKQDGGRRILDMNDYSDECVPTKARVPETLIFS